MKIRLSRIMVLAIPAILVASVVLGGYDKKDAGKPKPKEDIYSQVELFADAVSVLKSDYVDEVDSKKLIYGSLKGMLSSLDDFSQFMEPEEYNEIKVETKGEFGGIGTEISLKDGIITVITPIAGTPAEAAGIMPQDKIIKIDQKITKDMKLSDAVKEMRGKPGTTVTLTIWREKGRKVLEIPVKRAVIKIRSIKEAKLIDDKTGYIKLVEFQENTPRDLEEALKKLEGLGMDALILDLRNNPGGLLDTAVDVSEKFLPKDKVIVSLKSRNPAQDSVFKSSGRHNHPDYPLIVMANEGSASASEIVAGAVQDNKRGLVLGTKTFGKASVQSVIALKDGSALRFTSASYLTPSGKIIRNHGIIPDVVIERQYDKDKNREEKIDVFEELKEKNNVPETDTAGPKEEKDNQLEAAINLLKAIKIYRSRG